jgi:hypothetical protein
MRNLEDQARRAQLSYNSRNKTNLSRSPNSLSKRSGGIPLEFGPDLPAPDSQE